ncbi:tRNA (cytosine(34)-C(5))-methyltransferase-like, partial [Prunus avium]
GKPNSLEGDLGPRNDEPQVQLQNQSTEDTNGIVASLADGTDETFSEAASEAELIKDELDGDSLELDPSVTCEENVNVSEEAQAPSDKEIDPKKAGGKRKLQTQGKWRGVDPVVFFKDEATINSIKTFYGIDESFPFNGHLVTRNSDANHVKRIYYVSKSVKDVLELNFSVGQQLKITSIGLKMFERQTAREGNLAPCSFRISSEGLPLILPYITKQIVYASPVDFKHLLQYKSIKFADFVDAELGQKASGLMSGCCVIVLRKDGKASSDSIEVDESTIAIGCWKGKSSLSVMVTAIDCQELLERLLMRMETEKGSLEKKDEASNAKGDEEQDIEDMEKN